MRVSSKALKDTRSNSYKAEATKYGLFIFHLPSPNVTMNHYITNFTSTIIGIKNGTEYPRSFDCTFMKESWGAVGIKHQLVRNLFRPLLVIGSQELVS